MHHYHVYGLNIASEVALDWPLSANHESTDLMIRIQDGQLPEDKYAHVGVACQWQQGFWYFTLPGLGAIVVRQGQAIDLYPHKSVTAADIGSFIEHPALSAALLQRNQISLYGTAVAYDGQHAFGLLSVVPSGKSSLAYSMSQQGWVVVSDGMVVPYLSDNQSYVKTGPAHLTLWQDSCQRLGIDIDAEKTVRPGIKQYQIATIAAGNTNFKLTHLFVLQSTRIEHDQYVVQQGLNAFRVLQQHCVGEPWLKGMGVHKDAFVQMTALANSVSVHRVLTQKQDRGERMLAQIRSVLECSQEIACV